MLKKIVERKLVFVFLCLIISFDSLVAQDWVQVLGQYNHHSESLYDIANPYKGAYFAVGPNGVILKYTLHSSSFDRIYINSHSSRVLKAICFPTSDIGYVAGEFEILKTENQGLSWKRLSNATMHNYTSCFFIDGNHGCLVSSDGYIMYTNDGGSNFQEVYINKDVSIHKIKFINTRVGYAVGSIHQKDEWKMFVLKSTDGGLSWKGDKLAYDAPLKDLIFWDENHGMAIGDDCVLTTNNGGKNWSYNDNRNWSFTAIAMSPDNSIVAVGKEDMKGVTYISTDQGVTWKKKRMEMSSLNNVLYSDRNSWISIGNEDTFIESDKWLNEYNSFKSSQNEIRPNYFFFSTAFADSLNGVSVGSFTDSDKKEISVSMYTHDGGINWVKQHLTGIEALRSVVNLSGGDTYIAVGSKGELLISLDAGVSWQNGFMFEPNLLRDIAIKNSSIFFVVDAAGNFYRSLNAGIDWQRKELVPNTVLAQIHTSGNGNIIISGDSGTILLSKDNGEHFVNVSIEKKVALRGIAFSDDLHGLIVGDKGTILRTDDGGFTWKECISHTNEFLSSVAFQTKSKAYAVGVNNTYLVSYSGGQYWEKEYLDKPGYENIWFTDIYFKDEKHGFLVGDRAAVFKLGD